jgi:cell division transport system ATP-binding protein
MIRLDAVTMTYPAGSRPALSDVTLRIDDGEFVFLVGPSGSGKSTLLRLLLREERATTGLVALDGVDLAVIPDRRVPLLRRSIGCVFQDFRLLPDRTVAGNVAFALDVVGRPRHVVRSVVPEVLGLVGLAGKENRYPDELSGGEQQRVALARALVTNPALVLADEPTGNLPQHQGAEVLRLFQELHEAGNTILLITHNPEVAAAAQRQIHLLDGAVAGEERAA